MFLIKPKASQSECKSKSSSHVARSECKSKSSSHVSRSECNEKSQNNYYHIPKKDAKYCVPTNTINKEHNNIFSSVSHFFAFSSLRAFSSNTRSRTTHAKVNRHHMSREANATKRVIFFVIIKPLLFFPIHYQGDHNTIHDLGVVSFWGDIDFGEGYSLLDKNKKIKISSITMNKSWKSIRFQRKSAGKIAFWEDLSRIIK